MTNESISIFDEELYYILGRQATATFEITGKSYSDKYLFPYKEDFTNEFCNLFLQRLNDGRPKFQQYEIKKQRGDHATDRDTDIIFYNKFSQKTIIVHGTVKFFQNDMRITRNINQHFILAHEFDGHDGDVTQVILKHPLATPLPKRIPNNPNQQIDTVKIKPAPYILPARDEKKTLEYLPALLARDKHRHLMCMDYEVESRPLPLTKLATQELKKKYKKHIGKPFWAKPLGKLMENMAETRLAKIIPVLQK